MSFETFFAAVQDILSRKVWNLLYLRLIKLWCNEFSDTSNSTLELCTWKQYLILLKSYILKGLFFYPLLLIHFYVGYSKKPTPPLINYGSIIYSCNFKAGGIIVLYDLQMKLFEQNLHMELILYD